MAPILNFNLHGPWTILGKVCERCPIFERNAVVPRSKLVWRNSELGTTNNTHQVWVFLSWTLWTTFGQSDLITIEKALNKFHSAQEIFCTSSVCQKGFNLPRQHSMVLCSSRTFCSTWARWLWLWRFACCTWSLCFRYSVRAAGLWA